MSEVPVMLPLSSFACTGSEMAVKITGMSLSSAAEKQATAEGVAMAHMRSTLLAEKLWAIWVLMVSSN